MEQDALSAEVATLDVASGGALPRTFRFDWQAGSPPTPGLSIEQAGGPTDNSIQIRTSGDCTPGSYLANIVGTVIDANGYTVNRVLEVQVEVVGIRDWAYDLLNLSALTDEETPTTSDSATLGGGTGGVSPYTFTHGFFSQPASGLGLLISGGDGESVAVTVDVSVDVGTHVGTIRGIVEDAVGTKFETFLNYSVEVTEVAQLISTIGVQWDSAHAGKTLSTGSEIEVEQLKASHTPFGGSFHVLQFCLAGNRNLASDVADITLDGTSLEEGNEYANYFVYTKYGNFGAQHMTTFLFVVRDNDPAFAGSDPRGPWTWVVSFAGGFDGTAVARSSSGSYMPIEGNPVDHWNIVEIGSDGFPTQMDDNVFDIATSPDEFWIPLGGIEGVGGGNLLAGYALHMQGVEQVISGNLPNMVTPDDQGFQELNVSSLRPVGILSRLINLYRSSRSIDAALEQAAPADADSVIFKGSAVNVGSNGAWTCTVIPPLLVADDTWTPLMEALNPDHWWRFQTRQVPTTTHIPDDGSGGEDLQDGFTAFDADHHNVAGLDVATEGLSGALDMEDGAGRYFITGWTPPAAATGTILILFRHPVGAPPTNNDGYSVMWSYGRQGNSGSCFQLQINGLDGLEFRTLNQPPQDTDFEFVRTYDMSDLGNATGFHLAAMVKSNDSEVATLFIDGGRITSFSDVEGVSSNKGMWFADVPSSPGWFVKSASVTDAGWDGTIDELIMFRTQELTQLEIQQLTLSLGLPIRGDG